MELNVDSIDTFSSKDDFYETFPEKYSFYKFSRECNPLTGEYFFTPYTFSKALSNINIVAMPDESVAHDIVRKALVTF